MAIELICSETSSMGTSPRISFSYDLSPADGRVPIEQYIRSNSSSSAAFDFCVFRESFDQESSSADELFFDGKILPIEIKRKLGTPKKLEPPPSPQITPAPLPQSLNDDFEHSEASKRPKNEIPCEKGVSVSESDEKHKDSKSFWRFNRSRSLNCGSSYARSLCPLPLLSRSNSTGSTPNVKRSSFVKENFSNKQHNSQKSPFISSMKQSQFASSTTGHQKPPLKKNYGSYANSVKVNPVLNVPTPSLFGLGSIFSSAKDKNKKK